MSITTKNLLYKKVGRIYQMIFDFMINVKMVYKWKLLKSSIKKLQWQDPKRGASSKTLFRVKDFIVRKIEIK